MTTRYDNSYTGRGTMMGAAVISGRAWRCASAVRVDLGVSEHKLRKILRRLKVPKHFHYWQISDQWYRRIKDEL